MTGLHFHKDLELERVHRVPSFKPSNKNITRQIVCCPLRYQHTELILTHMHKSNHILWNGLKIFISQDYLKSTVDSRKGFVALRPRLKNANLQFSFIGPAKFKVLADGKRHIFNEYRNLHAFLDERENLLMDTHEPYASKS